MTFAKKHLDVRMGEDAVMSPALLRSVLREADLIGKRFLAAYKATNTKSNRSRARVKSAGSGSFCVSDVVIDTPGPSFADALRKYVSERCGNKASLLYKKAFVSRQIYNRIASVKGRNSGVDKRTAVAFALAMELDYEEAQDLLRRAGTALSPAIDEDLVFIACFKKGVHDILQVNQVLYAKNCKLLNC